MRNKRDKQILITKQQEEIYIINEIVLKLNKIALLIKIYLKLYKTFLAIYIAFSTLNNIN